MTGFVISSAIVAVTAFVGLAALWDGVFKLSAGEDPEPGILMLMVGGGLCVAAYYGASLL